MSAAASPPVLLDRAGLDRLLEALREDGYVTVGPTVRDAAVCLDEIETTADLPAGWGDEQDAGRYRLQRRGDGALFGHAVGQHSWKQFLFPPMTRLWRARRGGGRLVFAADTPAAPPHAFIGVRACDLAAIRVQDLTFAADRYKDPLYVRRRREAFLVAVQCGTPSGTCFCASMKTGPGVRDGYDLRLTELLDERRHDFLAEAGTARGAEVLARLPGRAAADADREAAAAVVRHAEAHMGRAVDTERLPELLLANPLHPRWADVALRCLTCGNCTLACPTCFCFAVEDRGDLANAEVERLRRWDSCYALDYSYIHGGSVRSTPLSRYRHWLTHKLATWFDQFGVSGCIGCGRCITWCPASIDITEEVRAIRESPHREELPDGHA